MTPSSGEPSPPLAFTQGVGTVFQWAGIALFLATMAVCCGSGFLSPRSGERWNLTEVGWHVPSDASGAPTYSAARAITVCVFTTVFLGLALAAVGLGLQGTRRLAPLLAVAVTGFGTAFWIVHILFYINHLSSWSLIGVAGLLCLVFAGLLGLAIGAFREMRRTPPNPGHEILPLNYKVPYSHLHDDPPEVRLARELEQRRERLAIEQKELELLQERLRRKLKQTDD